MCDSDILSYCRYANKLAEYHDDDHLVKFEELLEAAVDLDKIPDEYLICASYDSGLQVCFHGDCVLSLLGSTHVSVIPVNDGVHASCNRLCNAMVCLAAPLCDIVHAALLVCNYCGIAAFGGVVANGASDTVQGDCV